MAVGPLRARTRPPLRSRAQGLADFSQATRCARWENSAPRTLHSTALPAQISSARRQKERAATPLIRKGLETDRHHRRTRYGTDHQEDAQAPLGGTLEHLDPTSLDIGDNVREYPNLNKPFLDSIAEHGVLAPLTAIRRHGAVEVRNGQRRIMAARKLGLSTVPVYVLPATGADTAAETVDRIVHQMVTNDHKSDLTDAQRARGIQQMIHAGLSVTKVAKIHRTKTARSGARVVFGERDLRAADCLLNELDPGGSPSLV